MDPSEYHYISYRQKSRCGSENLYEEVDTAKSGMETLDVKIKVTINILKESDCEFETSTLNDEKVVPDITTLDQSFSIGSETQVLKESSSEEFEKADCHALHSDDISDIREIKSLTESTLLCRARYFKHKIAKKIHRLSLFQE